MVENHYYNTVALSKYTMSYNLEPTDWWFLPCREMFELEVPDFVANQLMVVQEEECQSTFIRAIRFDFNKNNELHIQMFWMLFQGSCNKEGTVTIQFEMIYNLTWSDIWSNYSKNLSLANCFGSTQITCLCEGTTNGRRRKIQRCGTEITITIMGLFREFIL